jgi:hypothetical protein
MGQSICDREVCLAAESLQITCMLCCTRESLQVASGMPGLSKHLNRTFPAKAFRAEHADKSSDRLRFVLPLHASICHKRQVTYLMIRSRPEPTMQRHQSALSVCHRQAILTVQQSSLDVDGYMQQAGESQYEQATLVWPSPP